MFSGTFNTFRLSTVEEEDGGHQLKVKDIPLASSNGCKTTTTNFKLVVKGTLKKADDGDETIFELDFSDNFGFTYYTDTKVCPHSYIGQKVDEAEGNGQRTLALNGIDDKHTSTNSLVRRQLFLPKWASFFVAVCGERCRLQNVPTFAPTTKPLTPNPTPVDAIGVPNDPSSQCNAEDGKLAFDKCQCNAACLKVPVDCVDGMERGTGLTCDQACNGECCVYGTDVLGNTRPCRGFTGLIHKDGSCNGERACWGASIDEVKGPCCTEKNACNQVQSTLPLASCHPWSCVSCKEDCQSAFRCCCRRPERKK